MKEVACRSSFSCGVFLTSGMMIFSAESSALHCLVGSESCRSGFIFEMLA